MSIANIVLTLDKIFEKDGIFFDVEIERFDNEGVLYKIWVSDFDFYFKSKKFVKILNVLRKKYPKVKFFCYYQNNSKN
jgi:hypothetical protein